MARKKDIEWNLPEPVTDWQQASVAVLMDIRDELKRMNNLLHCQNFIQIPRKLDQIRKNTTKRKYRKKTIV